MRKVTGIFLVVLVSAFLIQRAEADVLCLRNNVKANKNGKVNLKSAMKVAVGNTCPGGYHYLMGSSAPALDTCQEFKSNGTYTPAGMSVTVTLLCPSDSNGVAGHMTSWGFNTDSQQADSAFISSIDIQKSDQAYAKGVAVTSMPLGAGHTPTVEIICCYPYLQ